MTADLPPPPPPQPEPGPRSLPPRRVRRQPSVEELVAGVRAAQPAPLGQAITLVESQAAVHRDKVQALLARLLPYTGQAVRVGITGLPGAGKSTFIDALGTRLTARGHRVAVLAVDPTSSRTGGSILGDKTRMPRLAVDPAAFIRPSPSAGTLGGVARRTRETLLVCEAAGFDVVLVETVGVGQSETAVADMVDCFVVLMLAGGGDELQGIKRGVLELADLIAVTKADGDNRARALQAVAAHRAALRYLQPSVPAWRPRALAISAQTGEGIEELWTAVEEHRARLQADGELARKREQQRLRWMWQMIDEQVLQAFRAHPQVHALLDAVQRDVVAGRVSPTAAAQRLLAAFGLDLDATL